MKILVAHNFYQHPGGEDIVFRSECELLRENGNDVVEFTDSNARIRDANPFSIALQTAWSWETHSKLSRLVRDFRPDIAHFHNTFPLVSPSAYYACKENGVAVVQTLHNYRMTCPAATFYRDQQVCEKCLGKTLPWPAIQYKCYHDSAIQSSVLSASIFFHNILRTLQRKVDGFIALTRFSRDKFIAAGFPADKLFIKPNFVPAMSGAAPASREDFVIFVGRLTREKGVATLLAAWEKIDIPIYIFGAGAFPGLKDEKNIKLMDFVDRAELFSYMQRARLLVFPSEWYEGFPVSIAEAFACSLPVLSSDIGSQAEIVKDGYSGLHFRAGDEQDLRNKLLFAFRNPDDLHRMGQNAHREYEKKYTPEINYQIMMEIYSKVLERHV